MPAVFEFLQVDEPEVAVVGTLQSLLTTKNVEST